MHSLYLKCNLIRNKIRINSHSAGTGNDNLEKMVKLREKI